MLTYSFYRFSRLAKREFDKSRLPFDMGKLDLLFSIDSAIWDSHVGALMFEIKLKDGQLD